MLCTCAGLQEMAYTLYHLRGLPQECVPYTPPNRGSRSSRPRAATQNTCPSQKPGQGRRLRRLGSDNRRCTGSLCISAGFREQAGSRSAQHVEL